MSKQTNWLQTINIHGQAYQVCSLPHCVESPQLQRLPIATRILLENVLRQQAETGIDTTDLVNTILTKAGKGDDTEMGFQPARVLMQDFTGVPAVTDLAALRDVFISWGIDADEINPQVPVDLVIDHSVQVDEFGSDHALGANIRFEMSRNQERYSFLKWSSKAFKQFSVVPPGAGICHQVNLEYLAKVACHQPKAKVQLFPDTLVGTDSHTTMVNGLGVLGWGVGGIEAEAAMLAQPIALSIPAVVGVHLHGKLPIGTTATDLVLAITEKLRAVNVVEKIVEFFGPGLTSLSVADRATISNMSPEYGATAGYFPVDHKTLDYLQLTNRSASHIQLVQAYFHHQQLLAEHLNPELAIYDQVIEFDLNHIEASIAGPKRPQDRIPLRYAYQAVKEHLHQPNSPGRLSDGSVVIAAITSCTNTSNPYVMLAAGLLASKAVARGLKVSAWVKTSLAPGSRVVTDYLVQAGLMDDLKTLGFHVVGYGCTTCIGNSGPLAPEISHAISKNKLNTVAVLSGNRNFEGRIHPEVKLSYLASPPMVVAYALAGRMTIDWETESIGADTQGHAVYLRDIWPHEHEINELIQASVLPEMFKNQYAHIRDGTKDWQKITTLATPCFNWPTDSTYLQKPAFLANLQRQPIAPSAIQTARCLLVLGHSVTTDHISPAGTIAIDSPAADYLQQQGVKPADFNSYGARRGNFEVMMRGTFSNPRLKNKMCPTHEGGWTIHQPSGELMSIFAASQRYRAENVSLVILAGKEYGSGSSRDWAAKGTLMLGVKAVIAESYERIHRSNLVGMGVLPLQFQSGESAESLGLTGTEVFDIKGWDKDKLQVRYTDMHHKKHQFMVWVRLDTATERKYFEHGGILPYVARKLADESMNSN